MTPLTLYPAIDLKDGACVRLRQGKMDQATVYAADPAAQAKQWRAAGCRWLHVVDLDGAFAGRPINRDAVAAILRAVDCPVQLGGGIRDCETIDTWLEAGVARVILGSAALNNPALVTEACRLWPGRIVLGIDVKNGKVAAEGWSALSTVSALDLAARFEDHGAAAIIHTDISRDGMMGGVNLTASLALADHVRIPVIASGGVGSLADLQAVRNQGAGRLEGVVIGRALYDGTIDLAQAVRLCLNDEDV